MTDEPNMPDDDPSMQHLNIPREAIEKLMALDGLSEEEAIAEVIRLQGPGYADIKVIRPYPGADFFHIMGKT
jgi:hypothetical protein